MSHFVYILHSNTLDRFYVGETHNLEQRLHFHSNALPHKFTAKAKDCILFLVLTCQTKNQALKIERHIKKMKRKVYIKNLRKYPEVSEKPLIKPIREENS